MSTRHDDSNHAVDEKVEALFTRARDSSDATDQASGDAWRAPIKRRLAAKYRAPRRLPRARRLAAAAVLVAVAVGAAIAFAPQRQSSGESSTASLPASANASETLDWAGQVLASSGDSAAAGRGSVWHSTSRTFHGDDLVSINEQWFSDGGLGSLSAAWGRTDGTEYVRETRPKREQLVLDGIDARGTQHIRTYERMLPDGAWDFPFNGDLNPSRAIDVPDGLGDRQRALTVAVQTWINAVSGDAARADLVAATKSFMATTKGDSFFPQPEFAIPPNTNSVVLNADEMSKMQQQDQAVPIRQMLFLLTAVRTTPQATETLYNMLGTYDLLERLGDVKIDGRPAVRIRFDASDDTISPERQRVLVVDVATGRPLRTETLDRSSWTDLAKPERVEALADESVICGDKIGVPCELLLGEGPIAAKAATFVHNTFERDAALRIKGSTLCRPWNQAGGCDARSDAEAASLATIRAGQRTVTDAIKSNGGRGPGVGEEAFSTYAALSDATDTDGIIRGQSACSRDWRLLTTCIG